MSEKVGKKWYRSKLVWTGFIAIATAVVGALATDMSWEKAVIAGLGASTILIRAVTDEKIIW